LLPTALLLRLFALAVAAALVALATLPGGPRRQHTTIPMDPHAATLMAVFHVFHVGARNYASYLIIHGGSLIAFMGGLLVAVVEGAQGARATALAGLVVALAGLVTAFGGVMVPLFKLWLQERENDRQAKLKRHDFANHLNAANIQIVELSDRLADALAAIDENKRKLIEAKADVREAKQAADRVVKQVSEKVDRLAESQQIPTVSFGEKRADADADDDRADSDPPARSA